ncbi:hypothetical protein B0H13DRAFT_1915867 [Mycena leptocephala]|nr:hypothetical protein B0H13DRAFT_1915867 [Mycena leptocephala]
MSQTLETAKQLAVACGSCQGLGSCSSATCPRYKPQHGGAYLRTSAILTLRVYAMFNRKESSSGCLVLQAWIPSRRSMARKRSRHRSPAPRKLCMLSHVSHRRRVGGRDNYRSRLVRCFPRCLIAAVDVANILSYYSKIKWLTVETLLSRRLAWLASTMAVGDVASVEASTVEWNDVDGIPKEDTRGHVRNRASWGMLPTI